LFNIYDADGSGALDYQEFSAAVFGKGQAGTSRPGTAQSQSPEQLAETLKDKLASRGSRGIIGLARQFKIMDDDNSKSLSKGEFNKAMQDFALGFSPQQCSQLFDYFDVDKGGSIDYDEFLRAIRGPMNSGRKQVVAKAFAKLDKDGNGWIDISDIRGVYNAKKHPDVLQGKKTEDDILKEFLATFEMAHSIRNNDAPNYVVTKEEFTEYYNMISCSIDDDRYFQQMMLSCWKMDEAADKQEAATRKRAAMDNDIFGTSARREETAKKDANVPKIGDNANDQELIQHIRDRIAARGARGISGIGKKFKIADDDRSGQLDKMEFKKAMHDFRIGLNQRQVGKAFEIFDRDGSGEISYDEFLRSIRGKMNPTRAAIAKQAYAIMDSDKSGQLDINDIRQTYNAKQHPDVKAGKKTEDEILAEFLDTFEDHFADMKGNADARDGKITMEEWLEYYNNVSMSVDTDEYFKVMMNSTWNLDNSRVTKKAWGGEV
jgi:Ca2+-binding EF-hand superfamily protein